MKERINCIQFCSMFILIVFSSFLGIGLFSLIRASGVDAYISVLIAALFGIPVLFIFFWLMDYEPDLPLPSKVKKLCGKKLGTLINVILAVIVFLFGVNLMYNLMNFIVSQFLPETPTLFVGAMFLLVIGYCNSKGIEAMSRTASLLFVIVIVLFGFTAYGLSTSTDLSNLKPIMEFGIGRPIFGSLYIVTLNLAPFLMLLMIPKNQIVDAHRLKKTVSISYAFVLFMIFMVVFSTLSALGIYLISIYQYPEYIVLKRISLFQFLDRIENIVTAQWIFAIVMNLNFIVYYIGNTIKYGHKSKLLPYGIAFTLLLCARYLFPSNTAFNSFTYHVPPLVRGFWIFLCFFLCILVVLKKKKKKSCS